jgi:aminoglycoside phosphotransferase (APT) family kinase protein
VADSPAAEHTPSESDVRALLRAVAPDLGELPLRLVAEGWDNAIWRLGDDLAVRIPRREVAAPLIRHEQRALPILGPWLAEHGILSPVPVVNGEPTSSFRWPWSVTAWIAGERALGSPRGHNGAWAEDLALALRAIHRPAPDDAPPNPFRGNPLSTRDDVMQERLAQFPDRRALHDAWAAGLAAPLSAERVWIHGDVHPGNVVVRDCHLAALIDFGDVTAGDPAYDLAAHWLLFDRAGRAAFRHATGDRYDGSTWTRARAWAAYLTLVFLTQSDDLPEYREIGISTETELALPHRGDARPSR